MLRTGRKQSGESENEGIIILKQTNKPKPQINKKSNLSACCFCGIEGLGGGVEGGSYQTFKIIN